MTLTKVESVPVAAESIALTTDKTTLTSTSDKAQLTAKVTPSNSTDKVEYEVTSGTDVVSVSADGEVTASAEGTATIVAKAGSIKSNEVTITVDFPDQPTLTLTAESTEIEVGGTTQITATLQNIDGTVTFESLNTDVATVTSSGNNTATVTGVKASTEAVTITGTVTDSAGNKATGSIEIKVNEAMKSVTITFDSTFNSNFDIISESEVKKTMTIDGETVVLNLKKNSGSSIALNNSALKFINPIRIYQNHTLTFTFAQGKKIKGVTTVSDSSKKFNATNTSSSIGTVSDNTVTISDDGTNEITFTAKNQFRLTSIKFTIA